jgi:acetyl esterase/lipase
MASDDIKAVRAGIAAAPAKDQMPVAERRASIDEAENLYPLPSDVVIETAKVGGVSGEWVRAEGVREDAVLIYLHGGGYAIGSAKSHRHLVAALSAEAGIRSFLVDYRMAPEDPFPAAVDDALAVYRALLRDHAPTRLIIAGDSAGGGLVVSLMLAAKTAGLPQPGAGVCLSPWTDLTGRAGSLTSRADVDPSVTLVALDKFADLYLGDADRETPLASPIFGDLSGLPPLLIQVGSDEILFDDAATLDERARAAGVASTFEVWDEMIHVWQRFFPVLQEGREANARIGEYIRDILQTKAAAAAE